METYILRRIENEAYFVIDIFDAQSNTIAQRVYSKWNTNINSYKQDAINIIDVRGSFRMLFAQIQWANMGLTYPNNIVEAVNALISYLYP